MNVTDEELQVIDNVAKMLGQYFSFGYYDSEDIEQEVRIMCLEALPNFDKNKASLKTFLIVNAKNKLLNLQRDKLCKIFPPCANCGSCDDDYCEKYDTKEECPLFLRWQQNTQIKHNLLALGELYDDDAYYNTNVLEELYEKELLIYIDKNIPSKYRQDYLQFIHNGKMSSYAKNKIVRIIKRLAEDYVN